MSPAKRRATADRWSVAALTLAALIPALGGCGGKQPDQPASVAAGGEILPRSVTDDMLPYDTVRSQSAPAVIDGGPGASGTSAPDEAVSDDAAAAVPALTDDAAAQTPSAEEPQDQE